MNIDLLEQKILELYNKTYKPDYLYGTGDFCKQFDLFI